MGQKISNYVSNYDFVPYHTPEYYIDPSNGKRPRQELSGYIELEMRCVDNVYVGSGFSRNEDKQFVAETIKYDKRPMIPASSIKGSIRAIASAVSLSCLPEKMEGRKKIFTEKQGVRNIPCMVDLRDYNHKLCIVCDMFGAMSKASRINFCDMTTDSDEIIITKQKQQFSPDITTGSYSEKDGTSKGFKFYKTACSTNNLDLKILVETIPAGSIFSGRMFFDRLSEEEFSLLLFSLGLDGTICPKIGGYKNDGMGTVCFSATKLFLNGKEENAEKYAREYTEKYGAKCAGQIKKLREILMPKDGGKE